MGEEILGEISRFEYKNGRPLLSALVIRQSDFQQGKGFYQLAEDLEIGKRKFLRDNNFSVEEMKKCYDFWCDETKYLKYKDIDVEE